MSHSAPISHEHFTLHTYRFTILFSAFCALSDVLIRFPMLLLLFHFSVAAGETFVEAFFFCTEAKSCQQSAKACLMSSSWLQMPTFLNSTQHQKTERTIN